MSGCAARKLTLKSQQADEANKYSIIMLVNINNMTSYYAQRYGVAAMMNENGEIDAGNDLLDK